MLNFKKIEREDYPILNAFFNAYPSRQCDRSLGTIIMWHEYYKNYYAITDGTLIFLSKFKGKNCFSFPIGKNIQVGLDAIDEYCEKNSIPCIMCSVNKNELPVLFKRYCYCVVEPDRDMFDYIYDKETLMNLSGKKYSTPRNHINKFHKLYKDYSFEPVTKELIPEIIEFTKNFSFNSEKDDIARYELEMCIDVLENYEEYGLLGGVLKVDGKVIGYSVGEIIGDTLICHIEKANIEYHGAYQMVTNQFLRLYAQGDEVKYVNREDDSGDEGLRKAKLSYRPIELLEKNTVYLKKGC